MRRPLRAAAGAAALVVLAASVAAAAAGRGRGAEAELASPLYADPVPAVPAATRVLAPYRPDAPPTATVRRRLLHIGQANGDEHYALYLPADAAWQGDTLAVLDAGRRQVLRFTAGGAFVSGWGGRGPGPGEYESPAALLRLPWSGRLAVWDEAYGRLTVLSPTGRAERTAGLGDRRIRPPAADPVPGARPLASVPAGVVMEERSDALVVPPGRQRGWLLRVDRHARRDTLLSFAVAPVRASYRRTGAATSTAWQGPGAFTPEPHWDVFPDGTVIFAPGGPYEVDLVQPDGRVALRLTRPWRPAPVSRDDRLRWLRMARDEGQMGRSSVPIPVIERMLRGRFAAVRPCITGVLADGDGRFWVRRFSTADDARGLSRTWDVYARSGVLLGAVRVPPGFQPLRIDGGRLVGVRRDELGVRYVEVYENPVLEPETGRQQ